MSTGRRPRAALRHLCQIGEPESMSGIPASVRSLRHLDAKSHPLIFENHGDSINYTYAGIGFAMDYDFMLQPLGSIRVRKMLLRKSIVPPTIPSDQKISVFLKCTRKLRACELLNVEISVSVRVGAKRHLRLSTAAPPKNLRISRIPLDSDVSCNHEFSGSGLP
jgi:hypothetical protein